MIEENLEPQAWFFIGQGYVLSPTISTSLEPRASMPVMKDLFSTKPFDSISYGVTRTEAEETSRNGGRRAVFFYADVIQ